MKKNLLQFKEKIFLVYDYLVHTLRHSGKIAGTISHGQCNHAGMWLYA